MKKFTIFTIIFSAIVIITVGELVVNDYLGRREAETQEADSKTQTAESEAETQEAETQEAETQEAETQEADSKTQTAENTEDVAADASSDTYLSGLDYASYGFTDYELREKTFPTSVFYLLEFDDDSVIPYYYELFEGETYVGGLYEIVCSDPTEAFTVYTDLKQSGIDQEGSGTLNEVNNYGDASFYFNDNVKTTSIFLVVLKENRVYAFTYVHSYHDYFKYLFQTF